MNSFDQSQNSVAHTGFFIIADYIVLNLAFLCALKLGSATAINIWSVREVWGAVNISVLPIAASLGLYGNVSGMTAYDIEHGGFLLTGILSLVVLIANLLFLENLSMLWMLRMLLFLTSFCIFCIFIRLLFVKLKRRLKNSRNGSREKPGWIDGIPSVSKALIDDIQRYYETHKYITRRSPGRDEPLLQRMLVEKFDNTSIDDIANRKAQILSQSGVLCYAGTKEIEYSGDTLKYTISEYRMKNLIEQIQISEVLGISFSEYREGQLSYLIRKFTKRCIDIGLVLLLSPLLLIIGGVVALGIKLTSPGRVLFKQTRTAYKGGPLVDIYKFRTMHEGADNEKIRLLEQNESDGALFKIRNDPRITGFGQFLRKYSLDELPQFYNVLKGELSIIGPRPLPLDDFNRMNGELDNIRWYKKRGDVKPGITGLWQISGRNELSFEDMCLLDVYYVEHQTFTLDVKILFGTIPAVVTARGAY